MSMTKPPPGRIYEPVRGKPTGTVDYVTRGPGGWTALMTPCGHIFTMVLRWRLRRGDATRCPVCHEKSREDE